MEAATQYALREELGERRQRLRNAIDGAAEAADLVRLLEAVDGALERLHSPDYGSCEICGGCIEDEVLSAHPMMPYCLCHLTPEQERELEDDLTLAWRIQSALLPKQDLEFAGWQAHYRYAPVGPVSGDYCDVIAQDGDGGSLVFAVGDVVGHGIGASLLMAHLNALVRSLIGVGLPLGALAERANRIFAESTTASGFATMVCGKAHGDGQLEVLNAGHCPPLLVSGERVTAIDSTGLPVGVVGDSPYHVSSVRLGFGDTLFLYTDGLTEATDRAGRHYGDGRLSALLAQHRAASPQVLADLCMEDLATFRRGTPPGDDLTILVVKRIA